MTKACTILVVEDDQSLNYFMRDVLKKHGYNVAVAFDGEEAINILKSEPVSLVLLDVLLPKLTGWDVLKYVRNDEKLNTLPVIIISNLDSPSRQLEMQVAGATDYVVKVNVTKAQLIELVEKHLQ